MARAFTEEERARLADLGEMIVAGLSCNINGTGLPCRSDRLYSLELMRQYIAMHDDEDEEEPFSLWLADGNEEETS